MPVDPRLVAAARAYPVPPPDPSTTAAERRAAEAGAAPLRRLVATDGPSMRVREAMLDVRPEAVPARIYRPAEGNLPGLIYLHGGGFWSGGLDDADALCRKRAAAIGCVVISIGYRLAPEHPFPAGLDDAWNATRLVVERAGRLGIDPRRLAIGGQSAGGNLAAVIAQRARDAGWPPFVAQLLEIPVTDASADWPSVREFGEGYGFGRADLEFMWRQYLPETANRRDPALSPLRGRLAGLPPAVITTVEYDVFRDQGEAYAHGLRAAGVPVHLRRWPGLAHGTADLDILLPDIAERYLGDLASATRGLLRSPLQQEANA